MSYTEKDIEHLEYQYSPTRWVIRPFPNTQAIVTHFLKTGFEVKEKLVQQFECELNVVYDNGTKTKMDIYYPKKSNMQNKDVLIFMHGGYWQEGSKSCYAFLGSHLNDLNCILVMVGYDLAPGESIDGMVRQIKRAVIFTGNKFPFSRLFVSGHSAGAHLAAMMMTQDWKDSGLSPHRIAGVCLLSGIFDLEVLIPTYINDAVKLGLHSEVAARNSPIKIVQSRDLTIQCRVIFVIAEHDSPTFHEQFKTYFNLLKEKLKHHRVEYVHIPGVDHFDMLEKCVEKDYILNKVVANFMKNDNKSYL